MLLHRMDRDDVCAGPESTHTNCDCHDNGDVWSYGDRHASNPDPQPDTVNCHGYHHKYAHLYPDPNLHRDEYLVPDSVPACDWDFHSHLYTVHDSHRYLYLYAFPHEYIYSNRFFDSKYYTHSIHYILPDDTSPIT